MLIGSRKSVRVSKMAFSAGGLRGLVAGIIAKGITKRLRRRRGGFVPEA